jgi:hypothetical protein
MMQLMIALLPGLLVESAEQRREVCQIEIIEEVVVVIKTLLQRESVLERYPELAIWPQACVPHIL